MPAKNPKLSPDQRVAALEWMAACEKLDHFLRRTPDYPELNPDDVTLMLDMTESALFDLRRTFEKRARSTPISGALSQRSQV